MDKHVLQSKTFWVNFVMGVLAACLPAVPQLSGVADWLKDSGHMAIVGSLWAVAGIALRLITKGAVNLGE